MPIPVLSAIAARARRIKLAADILQPHLHHPVLLAEDWATLDVLSAGCTILGVGLGTGNRAMVEREDELIGIPKARRGQAFDEAIRLVRRLWTEDHVTFEGAVSRCQDVTLGYRARAAATPAHCDRLRRLRADAARRRPQRLLQRPHGRYLHNGRSSAWRAWAPAGLPASSRPTSTAPRSSGSTRSSASATAARSAWGSAPRSTASSTWGRASPRTEGQAFLKAYHQLPFDEAILDRWLIHGPPKRCAERAGLVRRQDDMAQVGQGRIADREQ
jgi:alkanesulfonate monooxygenase SsuD/methylene tetrahydromethanopterin reductase-like flavin-dependent oxidoreductase (luciferase family)